MSSYLDLKVLWNVWSIFWFLSNQRGYMGNHILLLLQHYLVASCLLNKFVYFAPRVNTTEKIYARQNEDKPICLTSQKCFLMSSQILPRILQITRHESFPWKKHNQFLVFTTSNYTMWYPSRLLIIMLSGIIFQLNIIMYIIKLYFFYVLS